MASLNKVFLVGRLTRDPEKRHTPGGLPIASFGLAVNRYRKGADGQKVEETAFIDITAFGGQADTLCQYMRKGSQLLVEGHLRYEQWTSQEGQKRSRLGVVVENFQFLDSRSDRDSGGGDDGGYGQPSGSRRSYGGGGYESSEPYEDYDSPGGPSGSGGSGGGGGDPADDIPF